MFLYWDLKFKRWYQLSIKPLGSFPKEHCYMLDASITKEPKLLDWTQKSYGCCQPPPEKQKRWWYFVLLLHEEQPRGPANILYLASKCVGTWNLQLYDESRLLNVWRVSVYSWDAFEHFPCHHYGSFHYQTLRNRPCDSLPCFSGSFRLTFRFHHPRESCSYFSLWSPTF